LGEQEFGIVAFFAEDDVRHPYCIAVPERGAAFLSGEARPIGQTESLLGEWFDAESSQHRARYD